MLLCYSSTKQSKRLNVPHQSREFCFNMKKKLEQRYYTTRFSLTLSRELHKQLTLLAQKEGKSLNGLINETLVKLIVNKVYIPNKYPTLQECKEKVE